MEPSAAREWWPRMLRLLERDLWQPELEDLPWPQRIGIGLLRMGVLIYDGVNRHQLASQAAALTYTTLFSLVPTLAVCFAIFDAFGGVRGAADVLLPSIMDYLAVGVREEAASWIQQFLGNVHSGAIGAVGSLFLIVAALSLLNSIENVLNEIWGVRESRGYGQRVLIYWVMVTVTPILLLVALSFEPFLGSLAPVAWLLEHTSLVELFFGTILPLVLVCSAFALLYAFMTSVRVPPRAALVGGVTAGLLWWGAVHGYAYHVSQSEFYSSIYGSLSAIPIFLFWIYLCWLIVLVGAQIGYASVSLPEFRAEMLAARASAAAREMLALRVAAAVAERFLTGEEAPTRAELRQGLRCSGALMNQIVDQLLESGLLHEVAGEGRLAPSSDPRQTAVATILFKLRTHGDSAVNSSDGSIGAAIEDLYRRSQAAAGEAWEGRTLAELTQPR